MATLATHPAEKARKIRMVGRNVKTRPAASRPAVEIPTEEIAARAFELFCERGGSDGHDVEDWLQAEQELTRRRRRAIADS
jgi:DUF2934 family protein